ncbi:MAG TPA: hypothetical protein VFE38_16835 [Edaphobacter sp.]|nr:hypothetical protein [Edaphobacter sp.]
MSKREIVLLASRVIALLQITTALIDSFINLPEQALLLSQQIRLYHAVSAIHIPPSSIQWIPITFTILRIALLWLFGVLFWRCGPMIEQLFTFVGDNREEIG